MELIAIREAARRLGVSDTAVRKAIAAGRVTVAGRTPNSDRPLLAWPQCADDWSVNSDATKRTHMGSQGSPRRAEYAPTPAEVALPMRNQVLGVDPPPAQPQQPVEPPQEPPAGRQPAAPSLAASKAVREAYMARLAKLEYEQKSGKLVDADAVKTAWFKHVKAAQTRIMGIPSAAKQRCSDLPLQVVATIEAVCREAMEDLANGIG